MSKGRGQKHGLLGRVRIWSQSVILGVIGVWLAGIVIFAFLPVPFSAVMVERQFGAWITGDLAMLPIRIGCQWMKSLPIWRLP